MPSRLVYISENLVDDPSSQHSAGLLMVVSPLQFPVTTRSQEAHRQKPLDIVHPSLNTSAREISGESRRSRVPGWCLFDKLSAWPFTR